MKTQIHNRSTNDDVSAVSSSISTAISAIDFSQDVYFTDLTQNLNANLNLITEALNEQKSHSILSPADGKRDNSMRIIFYEVKSKTLWLDETIKSAAQKVYDTIEAYGIEITKLSYLKQSAQSKALFADLKKTEIAAAVNLLPGLAALIKQAENAQTEFDVLYDEYLSDKTENQSELSASKLKTILRELINDELLSYLKVMSRTQAGNYKICYDKIVTAIEENNNKVKARLKKANTNNEGATI